jgi:DNA-binding MarR family transcriptional regulator
MTNRIDRLEDRALVTREPDKEDRRSVIVRLTPAGRSAIDEAIHYRLEAAKESLKDLKAGERRQLADLLRNVVLAVDADGKSD